MDWLRWVGRSMALGSVLVAGGAATNQLLTGDHRLSWTAAYFALVFTVLGVLLDRLPSRTSAGKDRTSRRRYLRRVRASVEQMETIGLMTQAEYVLRTRQVYVDVALQPRTVTETMPDGGVGGVVAAAGTRMPLASFLTRGRVLAVLGAAGSGKTTLVRYTALKMAERRWWPWQTEFWRPRRIPLLLYLRDHAQAILAEPPQNLAAIGSAAPWLEGAVTGPWLQRRLERGQCAVLLDGLDEVADAQERAAVVGWVNTQISRYPGNTVVITSRPLGYEANRVAQADVLQVQRFTNLQIAEFLDAWFHAIEHRARQGADPGEIDRIAARGADDLMGRITAMPALLDLAANPLLLTMIANVHRYRGSLPGRRADLYAEMCQVLLHRRQEAKNLAAPYPGLDELGGDAKERLMRRLAWAMMVRHQRDIPIGDAETAIGTLPHRSGPVLTAQVFLDYARRSGLLLEHKPGHYGFTHLSLQEYLAATHVPGDDDHRRVLIDHVGDPWWRETILLWAARYDASPVVEACLAVRTVPALSLAYACADQAAELDQHLRDQLTKLLTSTPDDPAEVRLLDGVAADRQLGDFLQLDDGTTICATPVSQDLWNRYLRHLRSGDSLASSPAPTPTAVSEPIRGLWAADLPGFLSWLNGLSDDRPIYCFPTYAELAQLSDWIKTLPGTVWSYDEPGGYRLYQPEGISHPHFPTAAQLRSYPYLIIDRTYLLLHLATNTKLRLARLLLFGYLASRQDLPSRPEYRLVSTLDLVATIDAIRTLDSARASDIEPALERAFEHARARTRAHAHDLDLDRARALERAIQRALDLASDIEPGIDHALQRALDHARALARELDLALDLDRDFDTAEALDAALAHDRGLALAVAYDLDRSRDAGLDPAYDLDLDLALSRALDHARDLDLVLDPALYHAPDLDLDHALEIALDHARNLDNDPGLAADQVVALDYDLDQALTRDPDSDLDRIRNLAQDLARALDHARDLDLDRALDLDRDLARARGLDHTLDLGLELFRDLAVARRLQSDRWCLEVTWAGIGLLEAWTSRHARGMKVAPGLHAFMAEVLDECAQTEPQDDPHAALELVIRAISEHEENTWALALLGHAQELIAQPRGCDVHAAQNNSGVAAAMVLAAILAITAPASGGQGDDPHVILLRGVLTALISLTVPENKNQTVLLTRV